MTATANSIAGPYSVTATAAGGTPTIDFHLNNLIALTFSGVTDQSITVRLRERDLLRHLANGTQAPQGENLAVTLDGVTQQAVIGSDGRLLHHIRHRRPPRGGLSLSSQLRVHERRDLRRREHDEHADGHEGNAHDQVGQPRRHHLRHGDLGHPARCGGDLDRGRSQWSCRGIVHLHPGRGHSPRAGTGQTLSVSFTPTDTSDYNTAVRLGDDQCRQGHTHDRLGEPRRHHLRHRAFGHPARCDIVVDRGGGERELSREHSRTLRPREPSSTPAARRSRSRSRPRTRPITTSRPTP